MMIAIRSFIYRITLSPQIFSFVMLSGIFLLLSSFSHEEPTPTTAQTAQHFQLPLYFETNVGQADSNVKYLARKYNCLFLFTSQEIVIALPNESKSEACPLLRMQFIGGNPNLVEGVEEQLAKTNYFIGNDPQHWHTDVPNYAKLAYRDLYPGIDILFYGNSQQLEYDIYVSPESDPSQVRLHIDGATATQIDCQGNLQISTNDLEQIYMQKPLAYQMDGDNRIEIPADYILLANNEIGLSIGEYDTHKLLVIDPVLGYSTYLGGSGTDQGFGITIDASGNAYVTGSTNSANFPTTAGAFQLALAGSTDVYVTKLNPSGTALIYSTYLGGSAADQGLGIVIDASGNAYVTGTTSSANFPTTPGAFQTAFAGSSDVFVTKLNSTGTALVYSTYLGSPSFDQASAIDIDSSGNAYVTGVAAIGFPTTVGAFQTVFGGGASDAFVTKLNSSGTALIYSTYLGGSSSDSGSSIRIDSSGNAYVCGSTSSINFPTTPGAFQTALAGTSDVFVTQLNPTGTALIYSTYLGGSTLNIGTGISIDSSGNAYVVGRTDSVNFPVTAGAFQTTIGGSSDVFVTKLNPTGTALVYSTYLGGTAAELGSGIAIDASENAYVTGNTASANFPVTTGAFQTALSGPSDAFFTKLNSSGTALIYSTYLGGSGAEQGRALVVDSDTNAYVVGVTSSPNYPVTAGAFQTTLGGSLNNFVTKFTISPTITNLSPNFGPTSGGTIVTITGTNFTNVISVTFGATPATSFIVNSDTSITAVAPPGAAGTINVIVTTLIGSSSPSINSQYTYVAPTPPGQPLPPSNFTGVIKKNKFLNITEYLLKATWDPSPSPNIAYYKINKDNQTVGIIPASGPFVFKIEVNKHSKATFVIIAVATNGLESAPVPLTLVKHD